MKNILLSLLVAFPFFGFSQKINSARFLKEANSIIQFYEFERGIQRNEEMVALYFAEGGAERGAEKEIIQACITKEKLLKQDIQNAKIDPRYADYKNQVVALMDVIIECFDDLYKYGNESDMFRKCNETYQPQLQAHLDTLISKFGAEGYIHFDSTERSIHELKARNIPFAEKKKVDALLNTLHPKEAYTLLKNDPKSLQNDITVMYLSDILLKKKFTDSMKVENGDSIAMGYLYRIMSKGTYSPLLFEAWRKWRAIKQLDYGVSRTSEIPNDLYDKERLRLMGVILEHIRKAPTDEWAYMQFFSFNEYEIIHRFGDYPYGNQSAMERSELFYDK